MPEIRNLVGGLGAALTPLPAAFFDSGHAEERLAKLFGVKTMESFGNFSRAELSAAAALIAYIDKTQIAKRPPIEPPRRFSDRDDDADRRGDAGEPRAVPVDVGQPHRNAVVGHRPDAKRGGIAAPCRAAGEPARRPGADRRSALMPFSFSSSGRRCEPPSGLRSTAFRTCFARSRGLGSTAAGHATST